MRERIGIRDPGSSRALALVLLLALTAGLLASCEGVGRDPGAQEDIDQPTPEEQDLTGPQDSVTLEELTRRPARFYDERVTVNGRVGRVIEPNVFALTSADAAQSDDAFEVEAALVAGGSIPDLSEGQRVRVTGEVRQLDLQEIEQELNTNLDDRLYADYEEKPVVLPGAVEVLAGGETTGP